MTYRFFRHRMYPQFRMVLKEPAPFPPETTEAEWELTRIREKDDVNPDVRTEIAEKGYSLFKIGISIEEIPGSG